MCKMFEKVLISMNDFTVFFIFLKPENVIQTGILH